MPTIQVLSRNHRSMLAVTLNNLACYHRRRGQPKTALGLLLRALDLESRCKVGALAIGSCHEFKDGQQEQGRRSMQMFQRWSRP